MASLTPAELRLLYGDESSIVRLTSSAPPVVVNVTETTQGERIYYDTWQEEEPADRIGQSLSGQMVSLLGGITVDLVSYGPRWPVRRALQDFERMCRRRHRAGISPLSQWQDHESQPALCSDLLRAASIGVSLRWCCEMWGIEYPRAERLLEAGLRFVGERLDRWQDEQLGLVHDREACPVCREEEIS